MRRRAHELVDHPKLARARAESRGLLRSRANPAEFPTLETERVRAIQDPAPDFTDAPDDDALCVDSTYDEPA